MWYWGSKVLYVSLFVCLFYLVYCVWGSSMLLHVARFVYFTCLTIFHCTDNNTLWVLRSESFIIHILSSSIPYPYLVIWKLVLISKNMVFLIFYLSFPKPHHLAFNFLSRLRNFFISSCITCFYLRMKKLVSKIKPAFYLQFHEKCILRKFR